MKEPRIETSQSCKSPNSSSGWLQACSPTAQAAYSLLTFRSGFFHVQERIQGFYGIDIPPQVSRELYIRIAKRIGGHFGWIKRK
jgi:hypothetical protein